ncbi:hypothetical protein L207DRAFT_265075 [Hyaloscypha variabilis F]|uniref:Uncharacterized protein n=1 Tax=Hyaloscypha variabilis (strain UAMH 11265 / GT02V1 / F) TaxID=1149755 RepID=A0A2J6QRL0_HYAVF|nr:hypothetical protein L207DRAFT_265075 [Hyaloscypha variabilis F]
MIKESSLTSTPTLNQLPLPYPANPSSTPYPLPALGASTSKHVHPPCHNPQPSTHNSTRCTYICTHAGDRHCRVTSSPSLPSPPHLHLASPSIPFP